MFELPTSIEINGAEYNIRNRGDYRVIIDCFVALDDMEMSKTERIYSALIIFYEDLNDITDILSLGDDLIPMIEKMFLFFNCNQPPMDTPISKYKLVDWDKDSLLICSAVNDVAHTEIRSAEYIHWWTFMGYYMAVKECSLTTVVGIRYKIASGKSLDKSERKFRMDNPQYFTFDVRSQEDREADAYVKSIWNSTK